MTCDREIKQRLAERVSAAGHADPFRKALPFGSDSPQALSMLTPEEQWAVKRELAALVEGQVLPEQLRLGQS